MQTYTSLIDFPDPLNSTSGRLRGAFSSPVQMLVTNDLGEIKPIIDQAHSFAKLGKWVIGAVTYEAAPAFDSSFFNLVHPVDGPLAWFAVFDEILEWDEGNVHCMTGVCAKWNSHLAMKHKFSECVLEIKNRIEHGEFYQVNYTDMLHGMLGGSTANPSLDFFHAVKYFQSDSYSLYFDVGPRQFVSVSPELFFDWHPDGRIITRPMKGTSARGATPEDDEILKTRLSLSLKERAENVMIVDLLRNDLSKIALSGSVSVPKKFHIKAYPTVWQMTSDIEAVTQPATKLSDVFTALFPCGSVTGAPKRQAMKAIHELENAPRGIYCGALGVIRPGGRATFNVCIRTSEVTSHRILSGVGSGITWDSKFQNEWMEWMCKKIYLNRASESFEILDSLSLRDGKVTHLLEHMGRLQKTCAHFGYPFPEDEISAALYSISQERAEGTWRLRLSINPQGRLSIQPFVLETTAQPVNLQLASSPLLDSQSEFVRFKTTRRQHYDAFSPISESVFDTILWNENNELTECIRGNIAVQLGDQWYTPSLSSGLLNGIARQVAITQGALLEKVLDKSVLSEAKAIAFLNDTRGWMSAVLSTPSTKDKNYREPA